MSSRPPEALAEIDLMQSGTVSVLMQSKPSFGTSGEGPMSHATITRQVLKRRSSRIALNARISLSGHDPDKCAFTMPAKATNLNRHGAVIQLNRELFVGSTVVVQNNSRRVQAPARVVTLVSALHEVYTYGVEFLEADPVKDFWGINFPYQSLGEVEDSRNEVDAR